MKLLFLTWHLLVIFNISLMGQEKLVESVPQDILDCLVEMGKDTVSTLNVCEAEYLNFCFQECDNSFDFCEKKIAFFKGNTGTIKSTKEEYFVGLKRFIHQKGFLPSSGGQLIILNEKEVSDTGYDAVIISLSKKYLTNKEVFKQLKSKKK